MEALVTSQHKGLKFEHIYNVHWRHGCNQAAAITPKFLISWNQNQGTLCTYIIYINEKQQNKPEKNNYLQALPWDEHMNTCNSKQTTCLCRDTGGKRKLQAQRTSFNTLDNWGHKIPTQSKKRKDRKEKVKGSWPWTHTMHSDTHVSTRRVYIYRWRQLT